MDDGFIDFLVLAPVPEEYAALKAVFAPESPHDLSYQDHSYYTMAVPRTDGTQARVRIVKLPHQGVLTAAVSTCRLIDRWHPACVVSFGIMGGFIKKGDLHLCDVVVAEAAIYYEPGKEAPVAARDAKPSTAGSKDSNDAGTLKRKVVRRSRFLADPQTYKAIPTLQFCDENFSLSLCERDFVECPRECPEELRPEAPRVRTASIASGEKVLADSGGRFRSVIAAIKRKTCGVEMEAAGVGRAAERTAPRTPRFLIVKGVSDNAGEAKEDLSACRIPAAFNAALCLRSIVRAATALPRDYGYESELKTLELAERIITQDLKQFLCYPPYTDPSRLGQRDTGASNEPTEPVEVAIRTIQDAQAFALASALRSGRRPIVYYQWRIRNRGVHWVDFYFLLLLRRLRDELLSQSEVPPGFPTQVLVTDVGDKLSAADLAVGSVTTERIVRCILGEGALGLYSRLEDKFPERRVFTNGMGLRNKYRKRYKTLMSSGKYPIGDLDDIDMDWVDHMLFTSRHDEWCIILNWYQRAPVAELLKCVLTPTPIILETPDLLLDGKLGKLDAPGRALVIDPPTYNNTLTWIEGVLRRTEQGEYEPLRVLSDLKGHMTRSGHGNEITEDYLIVLLANHPSIRSEMQSKAAIDEVLRSLFGTFLEWNRLFEFGGVGD